MSHSPLKCLTSASSELDRLVTKVRDDQWSLSTPCSDWSVRDLVEHITAGNELFSHALSEGSAMPEPGLPKGSNDIVEAHSVSIEALLAAFAAPGALDRFVDVPMGSVPGIAALHLRLVETVVHGWDLARATAQCADFDDDVVRGALDFTDRQLAQIPPERSPFDAAHPAADDAPALDRLVALLGRDPD